jgi:hypothetical protein
MALTAARKYTVVGKTDIIELATAGNDTFYEGALLIIDADGYANVPADAATSIPIGVYTGRQGQAFAVASGSHDKIEIERGLVWVPFSGAAQSDVGELFYLSDDGTLTQTAGSKAYALMCVGFKTGYVLLDFRNLIKAA